MPVEPSPQNENAQPGYGQVLVQQVLIFMTVAVILALLQYLFGSALSSVHLYLSVLLSVLFGYHRLRAEGYRTPFQSLVASAGLFGVPFLSALAISLFFYDSSYDGQHYHQEAIIALAGGWNPLRDSYLSAPGFPEFINYFSKAAWIVAATIYKGTGFIESGKAINLLLIIASFFSVRSVLEPLDRLNGRAKNVIALLLALNPVAVCQMFSFMVDGILSSLFLILFSELSILLRIPARRTFSHRVWPPSCS